MLDYEETMVLLEGMKAHYDNGFTSSERNTIESLYNSVCRKPIRRTGCSDCYRDAYIELVTTLKRLGKMPTRPTYVLKAGTLIHEFGSSNFYTLDNIPENVADKWLAKNPEDICLFETYPSDWQERAKKAISSDKEEDKGNGASLFEEGDKDKSEAPEGDNNTQERPRRGRPSTK